MSCQNSPDKSALRQSFGSNLKRDLLNPGPFIDPNQACLQEADFWLLALRGSISEWLVNQNLC